MFARKTKTKLPCLLVKLMYLLTQLNCCKGATPCCLSSSWDSERERTLSPKLICVQPFHLSGTETYFLPRTPPSLSFSNGCFLSYYLCATEPGGRVTLPYSLWPLPSHFSLSSSQIHPAINFMSLSNYSTHHSSLLTVTH